MKQIDTKNTSEAGKKRLKEILEILMSNDVTKPLTPEKLKSIFQDLGPYFTEIGKIMASRQDILPKDYRDGLATLQDIAAPMLYDDLKLIIENEYGVSIDVIFTEFDETPLEVSSIMQSHKATLQDGSTVIVKFQRPNAYNDILDDISHLRKALSVLRLETVDNGKISLSPLIDEIWSICQQEFNFLKEAENTDKFYNLNKNSNIIGSPKVNGKYTTANILVLEHIDGIRINDIEQLSTMGYDLKEIAENLADNYAKQFLYDGFFHACPSGDNILIKNGKIIWTDFCSVGSLTQKEIGTLARVINAAKKKDIVELKNLLLSMSAENRNVNNSKLYSALENLYEPYEKSYKDFSLSNIIKDIAILLSENGLFLPEQFSKLCIGLISIETILNTLSPNFSMIYLFCETISNTNTDTGEDNTPEQDNINPNPQSHKDPNETPSNSTTNDKPFDIHEFQANQMNKDADPNNKISQDQLHQPALSYDVQEKTIDIFAQISDILKMVVDGQTKINLQVNISDKSLSSADKILNKLIMCIISVSCLIGACTLISTDLQPRLLGLPVIGLILFVVSIVLLILLIARIVRKNSSIH